MKKKKGNETKQEEWNKGPTVGNGQIRCKNHREITTWVYEYIQQFVFVDVYL